MSAAQPATSATDTAEMIAEGLGGRRSGSGYVARCPAHDDKHPSLSIREESGQILFKCHAGCPQDQVIRALRARGLWPSQSSRRFDKCTEITYVYNDESGRPLYRVCRTPDKRFFLEHYEGGEWRRGGGSRTVLYHLDEVIARRGEWVYIAEGEKDVDRLRSLGYLATCNPMGAGKWKDHYSAELASSDVFVFFDNDSAKKRYAGQNHAADTALSLITVGCRVRVVELPYGKDVSEFLDFGGSMNEIQQLVTSAPILKVTDISEWRSRFRVESPTNPPYEQPDASWLDPLPFVDEHVQPLPAEILPGFLGQYCDALAQFTETPSELSVLAILGVLSTTAAAKVQIEAEPGYVEPANIYACAILESGGRKTAVLATATQPLLAYEYKERQRMLPEIARLESERKTKLAFVEKLRKGLKNGDESEIRRITSLEAELPCVPHVPALFSSDATAERLEVLLDESGGRTALISDEGGPFDVMNGRYNGIPNLDVFLKGHCQTPLRVHRMGRTTVIDKPHLSILVSPQPAVLRGLKEFMRGRGLLARFLYVYPESCVGKRKLIPSHIPSEIAALYRQTVTGILEWQPATQQTLRLSYDAYPIWKDFQRRVERDMGDGQRLCRLRDWGSKLQGAALRIATLLHLARHAERLPALPAAILTAEMESAVEICKRLISHAIVVFGRISEDPVLANSKRLARWLSEQEANEVSKRDCFRAHQPHVFQTVQELDACLNVLTCHRLVRVFERKTGGRSSEVIQLNPRLQEPAVKH